MGFRRIVWIFIIVISIFSFSCRKDERVDSSPSAKLEFSQDTVIFDTVFSTVGSVTKWLVVRNKNKDAVNISSISILGGTTQFRMNVDGRPGRTLEDIEIPGNDSIFIFVEVTVNPNDDLLPFLITDQIQFITNGNDQRIDLVAYGQNAIFYTPDVFTDNLPAYTIIGTQGDAPETIIWDSILPIVIYGYAVVDEGDRLIIREGTKIYLHGGAGLWIFQGGNIKVNGTKDHPVVFQGDRLDAPFNELSGQWDRIWINEGTSNNTFNYAVIKNAFIGIQAETLPFDRIEGYSSNKLELFNTIIDNSSALGLFSTNYQIDAKNTIISNSGVHSFGVAGGGIFNFDHCTFANYWNESTRTTPSIFMANSFRGANGVTFAVPLQEANFRNCIIYGNNDSEFDIEQISEDVDLNYQLDNCIVNTETDTNYVGGAFNDCIINPRFANIFQDPFSEDFHLSSGSIAINKGAPFTSSLTTDFDGVDRTVDGTPDIGAYEFAP